jgi:hypothetical protein
MTTPAPAVTAAPAPPPPPKILRESAIIPIIMIGMGGYLLWFGVRYWRGAGAATWPSYPVKSVLQGKGVPPNIPATTAESKLDAYESAAGAVTGGSTYTGPIPYRNPLRGVKGLQPERIDMGVDYGGAGPVYAAGPGVVTEVDTAWAGGVGAVGPGTFIAYMLTAGPLRGKYIYTAENITPDVRVGQAVTDQTVIGHMTGQGAGIETGFAAGPTGGQTLAAATGQASRSGDPGANTTAYGRAWSDVLAFLGAPAGKQGGPDSGSLPPGWWVGGGGETGGGKPQNTARLLLSQFGWRPDQMPPLIALWTRESGWSPVARNPQSGALGIAQALGHGGAGTAGTLGNEYGAQYGLTPDQAKAANSGNALQQIRWGLGYIKARYGSPGAAEAHEQSAGWY